MPREAPYLQVAENLRHRIQAGEWAVGSKLPGRPELAAHYGVSPSAIQKAQERLVIEGLLEGRAGSGTYVREPRRRHRVIRSRHGEHRDGSPFRADMRELGMAGTWEARWEVRVPATEEIAARLGLAVGDPTVRTTYEFLADGRPVQLSTSWEPMSITGGSPILIPEAGPLAGQGVVARMGSIGVEVTSAAETPRPGRATMAEAGLLGISVGEMVTRIERTYYADGVPVETADIVIPDRWDITYEFPVVAPAEG
jgi:GntR family transcriptional regulator